MKIPEKDYLRKRKYKRDMERSGFLRGKKTRVWPKKLHFVKFVIFWWNIFNENVAKLVTDNAVCEKLNYFFAAYCLKRNQVYF